MKNDHRLTLQKGISPVFEQDEAIIAAAGSGEEARPGHGDDATGPARGVQERAPLPEHRFVHPVEAVAQLRRLHERDAHGRRNATLLVPAREAGAEGARHIEYLAIATPLDGNPPAAVGPLV